jgi:RPA family protein
MQPQKYVRHTACKVRVQDCIESEYVQGSEDEMGCILHNGDKIYRVNIYGVVVQKEVQGAITNMMFDDGTGKVVVRSFEENKVINSLAIGDCIIVIGKIRTYNNERYISPEIIKKLDPLWLKVRQAEVPEVTDKLVKLATENVAQPVGVETVVEEIGKKPISTQEEDVTLPSEKIVTIIKELDDGNGVLMEDVIEKSPLYETEKIIEKMLERGEIFQNQPGKVKVL